MGSSSAIAIETKDNLRVEPCTARIVELVFVCVWQHVSILVSNCSVDQESKPAVPCSWDEIDSRAAAFSRAHFFCLFPQSFDFRFCQAHGTKASSMYKYSQRDSSSMGLVRKLITPFFSIWPKSKIVVVWVAFFVSLLLVTVAA